MHFPGREGVIYTVGENAVFNIIPYRPLCLMLNHWEDESFTATMFSSQYNRLLFYLFGTLWPRHTLSQKDIGLYSTYQNEEPQNVQ